MLDPASARRIFGFGWNLNRESSCGILVETPPIFSQIKHSSGWVKNPSKTKPAETEFLQKLSYSSKLWYFQVRTWHLCRMSYPNRVKCPLFSRRNDFLFWYEKSTLYASVFALHNVRAKSNGIDLFALCTFTHPQHWISNMNCVLIDIYISLRRIWLYFLPVLLQSSSHS